MSDVCEGHVTMTDSAYTTYIYEIKYISSETPCKVRLFPEDTEYLITVHKDNSLSLCTVIELIKLMSNTPKITTTRGMYVDMKDVYENPDNYNIFWCYLQDGEKWESKLRCVINLNEVVYLPSREIKLWIIKKV
jgi:hypothetical protein